MLNRTLVSFALATLGLTATGAALAAPQAEPPSVVIVHGAFADGSDWAKVIPILQAKGIIVGTGFAAIVQWTLWFGAACMVTAGLTSFALEWRVAIEAFRQASADGRVRRILYTSGVWVHGPSVDAIDEHAPYQPLDIVGWRPVHETLAYELSEHEVAVTIIRPGMVYGEHRGILGMWFAEAHDKKTLTYPGDGSQHWPLVHRDDLADLYVRALTGAKGGDAYLAGDGSWFTVKAMAEAVAAATGVTATSWPAEELLKAFGPFGQALLQDQRIQSTKAHTELGWTPTHTSFVDEADALWREIDGEAQA